MYVVLILTFFSMLFWAFFEQAGSSINNFTDRNVDRVFEVDRVTAAQVGQTAPDSADPGAARLPQRRSTVHARRPGITARGASGRLRIFRSTGASWKTTSGWGSPSVRTRYRPARSSPSIRSTSWCSGWYSRRCGPCWPSIAGTEHAGQVRSGTAATRAGLRGLLVCRRQRRRAGNGGRRVAVPGLSAPHHGRVVPVSGRPLDGHQTLSGAARQHRDGSLVPGHGLLAVPGRHHRPVHRRHGGVRGRRPRSFRFPPRRLASTATCSARSPSRP